MITQEMKTREKVKIIKHFSAADDQWLAADKKFSQSASRLLHHLQCIVGKTLDFPDIKTKPSDWLFRSKLTSCA